MDTVEGTKVLALLEVEQFRHSKGMSWRERLRMSGGS